MAQYLVDVPLSGPDGTDPPPAVTAARNITVNDTVRVRVFSNNGVATWSVHSLIGATTATGSGNSAMASGASSYVSGFTIGTSYQIIVKSTTPTGIAYGTVSGTVSAVPPSATGSLNSASYAYTGSTTSHTFGGSTPSGHTSRVILPNGTALNAGVYTVTVPAAAGTYTYYIQTQRTVAAGGDGLTWSASHGAATITRAAAISVPTGIALGNETGVEAATVSYPIAGVGGSGGTLQIASYINNTVGTLHNSPQSFTRARGVVGYQWVATRDGGVTFSSPASVTIPYLAPSTASGSLGTNRSVSFNSGTTFTFANPNVPAGHNFSISLNTVNSTTVPLPAAAGTYAFSLYTKRQEASGGDNSTWSAAYAYVEITREAAPANAVDTFTLTSTNTSFTQGSITATAGNGSGLQISSSPTSGFVAGTSRTFTGLNRGTQYTFYARRVTGTSSSAVTSASLTIPLRANPPTGITFSTSDAQSNQATVTATVTNPTAGLVSGDALKVGIQITEGTNTPGSVASYLTSPADFVDLYRGNANTDTNGVTTYQYRFYALTTRAGNFNNSTFIAPYYTVPYVDQNAGDYIVGTANVATSISSTASAITGTITGMSTNTQYQILKGLTLAADGSNWIETVNGFGNGSFTIQTNELPTAGNSQTYTIKGRVPITKGGTRAVYEPSGTALWSATNHSFIITHNAASNSTPGTFSFVDPVATNIARTSTITSAPVTLTGMDIASTVTQLSAGFTATANGSAVTLNAAVPANATLTLSTTSSGSYATSVYGSIAVGGVSSGTWTVTTQTDPGTGTGGGGVNAGAYGLEIRNASGTIVFSPSMRTTNFVDSGTYAGLAGGATSTAIPSEGMTANGEIAVLIYSPGQSSYVPDFTVTRYDNGSFKIKNNGSDSVDVNWMTVRY